MNFWALVLTGLSLVFPAHVIRTSQIIRRMLQNVSAVLQMFLAITWPDPTQWKTVLMVYLLYISIMRQTRAFHQWLNVLLSDDVIITTWHVLGACGRGQQYNLANTSQCLDCDFNFFQDEDVPLPDAVCTECPAGTGTEQMGSTSDQCLRNYHPRSWFLF